MDDECELEKSIQEYSNQLEFVKSSLNAEPNNEDLILLKSNLEEVLNLTKENLLSIKKKNLLSTLSELESPKTSSSKDDDFENELKKFQLELGDVEEQDDQEISSFLAELEGKKCRAPYSEEWGQLAYHNAIVLSVLDGDIDAMEEIEVKVLFCNPVCQSMKPCTFFLDGHCRFSPEQCRFSHGYNVKLSDLQDFKDPDYSSLHRDSLCLAKYKDDLWYKAIVEDVLDDHQYSVKYVTYQETVVRALEDLVPIDHDYESSSEDSISEDEELKSDKEEADELRVRILASENLSNGALGDWEKHTKGIGSKLMLQMGYIMGQGLGRNGEGITEPIEATIVPLGKSLDKCMEIREKKEASSNPMQDALKRRRLREGKEKKIIDGYHHVPKNIFDFINSKLKRCDKHCEEKQESECETVKKSSVKNLNLKMLRVSEDLNKAQKEMGRLKQSLKRNKDRDRKMQSHIENRISEQETLIETLRNQEKMIRTEQSSRNNQKKLTVF